MNMHKILGILFILFIHLNGFSQTYTIKGKVVDVDGHPISDARFYFSLKDRLKYKTDENGNYSIEYKVGQNDSLKFEHVAFENALVIITKRLTRKADTGIIVVDIVMPDRMLNVLEVRANVPDTLFGTQEYSVADYEYDRSGLMVLLTYEKTLSKGSVLRLVDNENKVLDKHYVQGESVELRSDFRGNVHLVCEEKVFLIKTVDNRFRIYLEERDYFFKYVLPIIDTIGENLYFSNYSELYPAFDYLEFNRKDSVYKPMLTVEDQPLMELYRAEFKYVDVRTKLWAHNKQIETGIDKEIWVGAAVFTNSIYYEPLYAPLFKVGEDSILVFDHYKNYLYKYTPENGFADSVRIAYHKDARKSGWEQPLLQDRANDNIYVEFLINGFTYLSEIDVKTGLVRKSFRLYYKYIEKIKIIDGYVYYIFRPFESIQKKYIYREKLS